MAKTSSYWLKLNRATQHLEQVKALVAEYERPRPYTVTRGVEGKDKLHVYRAYPAEEPDPWIAVVVGDLLFDLRSALDHMRVALVPRKYRFDAGFPIFVDDIWERDPETGEYLERTTRQREVWEQSTRGMSDRAKAQVDEVQPFRQSEGPLSPDRPNVIVGKKDTTLAILNRLNNADKHRELVTVVNYLLPTLMCVHYPEGVHEVEVTPEAHVVGGHGTVVARLDREVKVDAVGSLKVAIGGRSTRGEFPGYELPATLVTMTQFIGRLLKTLEPFTRSS